ncbi:uncharacterized protein LOC134301048 [Trichomycterus rosablanca]|uniref:uncharacterized protein LOC134301048 n=1 Tax=Trichomycterus rosablanca TaxID=2290929 RepID=UPI002F35F102
MGTIGNDSQVGEHQMMSGCSVWPASIKAKAEYRTAFFGEDIHIPVPALQTTEVVFKPRVEPLSEVLLFQNQHPLNSRVKLIVQISNLVLEDVGEEDEGTYIVRDTAAPSNVKHIILIVRDCATETTVKYGETYHIPLNDITGPYILEFRPSAPHANQTAEPPAHILLNQSTIPVEEYMNRLNANEKRVTLHSVTGADEGSYTVLDSDGKVRKRTCLNVKEHQNFMYLKYDGTLKINLYINHSKVHMIYIPDSDHKHQVILDQGQLVEPLDQILEGRAFTEGSVFYLKKVKVSDAGVFKLTDLTGFRIADVYVNVEPYKLPQLYVVILSLVGLLAFLLLVCLISCQVKIRRRAEKSRKIAFIAQQAGKGDGKTFRQVVHEAYTRFTEDSTLQTTYENNTETTEVEIKGLEVSKSGQYPNFPSETNFLENDSGVEFNTSTFPLDSDTDQSFALHKPLIDSLAAIPPTISEGNQGASFTSDSVLSASQPSELNNTAQETDFMGTTIPDIHPKVQSLDDMVSSGPASGSIKDQGGGADVVAN